VTEPPEPQAAPGPPAAAADPDRVGGSFVQAGGSCLGAGLTWAFAATVVGLIGVTLVGRMDAAPPALLAALVTFLPYLFATALLVGFGVWTLAPDQRVPPLGLAVLTLVGAALWGPSWRSKASASDGTSVRVMSWNLRRLWGGPADGGDPRACAVDVVRAEAPEVLTLMEVSADNVAWLAEALDLECRHHTYREGQGRQRGGLATCTRGERWSLGKGGGQRFVDAKDWYFVQAEVRGPTVFNLLAVHLSPYDYAAQRLRTGVRELARGEASTLAQLGRSGREVFKGQSDQAAALLDRVGRFRDPSVVAGDFNSTRDAALHVALRRQLVDAWEEGGMGYGGTIAFAEVLPLRIDYVYATRDFGVAGARVPPAGCSDHRPVVVDLVLPSPDATGTP